MAEALEKKVYHLGTWHDDIIPENVIKEMATLVKEGKGSKVKLTLTRKGLTVIKSSMITGKLMTDYIPFENIHFITVNQFHPQCLVVIGKDHPTKYQLLAFRCANGLDAGMFVGFFRDAKKRHTSPGEGFNFESKKTHDGANWTLRSKNQNNEDRQLSKIVDIHGENTKVNGDIHVHLNGGSHQENGVVRAYFNPEADDNTPEVTEIVTQVQPSTSVIERTVVRQESNEQKIIHHHISDNVSEVSEATLRDELDYLSQELRDIKFLLEKSTGLNTEEHRQYVKVSPRRVEQPKSDVVVRQQETVTQVIKHLDNDDNVIRNHSETNGKIERTPSPRVEGEVRVTVPDYRSSTVSKTYITSETREPINRDRRADTVNYKSWGGDRRSQARPSSNWRDDVVLRQRVHGRSRPRSAVYSTSSGSMSGSIRSSYEPSGYVLADYNNHSVPTNRPPTFKRMHVATSVRKPIERVYGRHSTYGGRPVIVDDGPQTYRSSVVDYNQNNVDKSSNSHVIIRT